MKILIFSVVTFLSLNSFAMEGCEVVLRSEHSYSHLEPQIAKRYSLGKCSWLLSRALTNGNWESGAAIHINEKEDKTYLKLEKVSREEFFKIRNGL